MFWWVHGLASDCSRWGEEALGSAERLTGLARARASFTASVGYLAQGDWQRAQRLADEALALFRAEGDLLGEGRALQWLAWIAPIEGDVPRALDLSRQAEVAMARLGDAWSIAYSVSGQGEMEMALGDLDAAEEHYGRALAAVREQRDIRSMAHYLDGMALIALLRGEPDRTRGRVYWAEGLPLALRSGQQELLANCLRGVAMLVTTHQPAHATRLLGAASAVAERAGAVPWPVRAGLYAQAEERVRERLGQAAYQIEWQAGRRLSPEEATAFAGEVCGGASVERWAPRIAAGEESNSVPPLSPREQEVAALIALGFTSKEIAERLVVSERTVDTHADHIRVKLGLRSRAEIAAWATEHGLRPGA